MSIRVRWHNNDQDLLVVQFTARWTWNAFFQSKTVLDNLLDDVNKPVNCLFLLPADIILPPDSIRNGQHAFNTMHPHLKQIIVVKPNSLIRTIYDMVLKKKPLIQEHMMLIESMEHALDYLDAQSLT